MRRLAALPVQQPHTAILFARQRRWIRVAASCALGSMVLLYVTPIAQAAPGDEADPPLPGVAVPQLTFPQYEAPKPTPSEKSKDVPAEEPKADEEHAPAEPAPQRQDPAPTRTQEQAPAAQPQPAAAAPAEKPVIDKDDYAVERPANPESDADEAGESPHVLAESVE